MKLWALVQEAGHIGENDDTDILLIPDYLDLKAAKLEWGRWYRDVYWGQTGSPVPIKYRSFIDFLKDLGAREPSSGDIQFFSY